MDITIKYDQNKEKNLDTFYEDIISFIKNEKRKIKSKVIIDQKYYFLNMQLSKDTITLNFEGFDDVEIRYPPLKVKFPNN